MLKLHLFVNQVFAESQDYGIHGERVRNACWGYLCQSGTIELREVNNSRLAYLRLYSQKIMLASFRFFFFLFLFSYSLIDTLGYLLPGFIFNSSLYGKIHQTPIFSVFNSYYLDDLKFCNHLPFLHFSCAYCLPVFDFVLIFLDDDVKEECFVDSLGFSICQSS